MSRWSSDSHAVPSRVSGLRDAHSLSRVVLPNPAGADTSVRLASGSVLRREVSRERERTVRRGAGTCSFVCNSTFDIVPPRLPAHCHPCRGRRWSFQGVRCGRTAAGARGASGARQQRRESAWPRSGSSIDLVVVLTGSRRDEIAGAELTGGTPGPGAASGHVHAEHHRVGAVGVHARRGVLHLHVQVRLAGVAVVPHRGKRLAAPHVLAHAHSHARLLEVGKRHEPAVPDVQHEVVGEVAVGTGSVVRVAVGDLDDPPVGGSRDGHAEAVVLGQRGVTAARVRPAVRAEEHEVDGVALVRVVPVEQDAGAAVVDEPLPGERRVEHGRAGRPHGHLDELHRDEHGQQGHQHVRRRVDTPPWHDSERRQQDQAGQEHVGHHRELRRSQGEDDACVVRATDGEHARKQGARQPDVHRLQQVGAR